MKLDVVIPLNGFEKETEFAYEQLDNFFSLIKSETYEKELRLMQFGALKKVDFELEQEDKDKLQIQNMDDISIYYIFVLQSSSSHNGINTFAPVIVNHKEGKIGQIYLNLTEIGLEDFNSLLPSF